MPPTEPQSTANALADAFDFEDEFEPSAAFELPGEAALEPVEGFPAQGELAPPAAIAGDLPPFGLAGDTGTADAFAPPPAPAPAPAAEPEWASESAGIADQPVPRISICAFCERPDTVALVQQAARDRRLARAHTEARLGGLPAAIEHYHNENTPNLILVESGMRGQALFEQLEELANVCDTGTKVVIIGAANDVALYRELLRRGISDYLVPPLTPLHLIRSIADLFIDPDQPFAGKVTAFIGAKGGVGASTLAHNTAWQIAEARVDTAILDLDLPFGTAGLDFNQDGASNIGAALAEPERVDDVLIERLQTRCTEHLSLFTAPATLEREWELDASAYDTVISQVRSGTPHVVLDLPHGWNSWIKSTLFAADDIVIVTSPDLAGLRNAKNLYDLLKDMRSNDGPPHIVVNQVGVPKRPEIPIKDFAGALGQEPALVLPFEPAIFGQAANNGQMIQEIKADSKAALGMAHLAGLITGRAIGVRKPSLFARMLGRG